MRWRLLEIKPHDAAMNMAIDHAIYEAVAKGSSLPTIRFYKWKNPSVSIGAYQNEQEINLEECKRRNVDVVRRMTGGRAVFHGTKDFTYSVIAHIRTFGYSIDVAYRQICDWLLDSLADLRIRGTIENKNDILVKGKKISGNAAKAMEHGIYLQHGTLVYSIDDNLIPKIMNISPELSDEKITSICRLKKTSEKKVYESLKMSFTFGKKIQTGKLSEYEIFRSERLAKEKYSRLELPPGSIAKNKGACYVERGN